MASATDSPTGAVWYAARERPLAVVADPFRPTADVVAVLLEAAA